MKCALLTILGLMCVAADAATLTFTNRTIWENSLEDPVFTDDFNSLPSISVVVDGETFERPNGLTITGSGGGAIAIIYAENPFHFQSTYIETDFESLSQQLIFSFDAPIFAFGFDYAAASTLGSIWITGVGEDPLTPEPNSDNFDISFYGFVSDTPISSIIFSTGTSDQDYGIDNFSFSTSPEPIPVPSAAWLIIGPVSLLIASGRKSRRNASKIG